MFYVLINHFVIDGSLVFIGVLMSFQCWLLLSKLPLVNEAKSNIFFHSEVYPVALYIYSLKLN